MIIMEQQRIQQQQQRLRPSTTIGSNNNKVFIVRPAIFCSLIVASFISFYTFQIHHHLDNEYGMNPIRQALLAYDDITTTTTTTGSSESGSGSGSSLNRNLHHDDHHDHDLAEMNRTMMLFDNSKSKDELLSELYPDEDPIPNPQISDGKTTFASCLLVMDDNHRLTEWLAYHYHVLPLRYLIVAVDPRSMTKPTHILNIWRKLGIVIEEWTDVDFWRTDLRELPQNASLQTKRDRHRGRQKFFYKKCLMKMKNKARTWVTLHDTDEYLVYNHAGGSNFEKWFQTRVNQKQRNVLIPSMTPPTTADEGAMIGYINHERNAGLEYYQSPCIGIPRLMFGAVEPNQQEDDAGDDNVYEKIFEQVPDEFHNYVHKLDTLKYRQHAKRNDFSKNALGKVLIDVSRVDVAHSPYFMSLHRPIKSICGPPWHNDWESGLRLNHYLGSWESYSIRENDSRKGNERSWEQWEYKATTLGEQNDDNIRPWISGFIESHPNDAHVLLEKAGLPWEHIGSGKDRDAEVDPSWKLSPDRLAPILDGTSNTTDSKTIQFEEWVRNKYGVGSDVDGDDVGVFGGDPDAAATDDDNDDDDLPLRQETTAE